MSRDDDGELVVREDGILMVLEEGEYCCVCKAHKDLMRFGMGDPADPMIFTVCNPCFDKRSDKSRFVDWLAKEMEESLASQPDKWRKNPDGTWTDLENPFPSELQGEQQ
jgi:hypothetical protein